MFHLLIIVQSVKNEEDTPHSSIVVRPTMGPHDEGCSTEHDTLPMVGELVVQFIQNVGISVLLAQDPPRTWLMKSQIRDYNIFTPQGLDSLTLVLVNMTISASLIPMGDARVCVVAVSLGRASISFISGYVQPMTGVGSAELGCALKLLGDDHRKCLGMVGNGHSPVWGPSLIDANPQGILLKILLASEDMFVINAPDNPPTYVGDDGHQSWLDVTAVSAVFMERCLTSMWKKIQGWALTMLSFHGSFWSTIPIQQLDTYSMARRLIGPNSGQNYESKCSPFSTTC